MLTDETLSSARDAELEQEEELLQTLKVPACIHHEQITRLISQMVFGEMDPEQASVQVTKHLDVYLEQPFLLDPYTGSWIAKIICWLHPLMNNIGETREKILGGSRIIYSLCKVRGAKAVLVYFEHSVEDVVPILKYAIDTLRGELGPDGWMIRYVSMLMASVVSLIPFDFEKFKNRLEIAGCCPNNLLPSLLLLVVEKLECSGRERQAAVLCISSLLCRRDHQTQLTDFLDEACEELKKGGDTGKVVGMLECICELIRRLPDGVNFERLVQILSILDTKSKSNNNLIRKIRVKMYNRLAGRIEISRCLQVQLEALNDTDTIVRWAAAKGVAQLSTKVTLESAGEIIECLFTWLERDSPHQGAFPNPATCHGITLSLAEMSRISTIPIFKIPTLIKWICNMLRFEVPRGRFAVGTAVRDAACYTTWALARSYPCHVIEEKALIDQLSGTLVCVSLFDREVSCRRAAAAALQELVGRWEGIPHGIELLGMVDFFTTHNRRVTFGQLALKVVKICPTFQPCLQDHLLNWSITSWDREIRQLSAPLLACLVNSTIEISVITEKLLVMAGNGDDLGTQHGAILTLAEITCRIDDSSLLSRIVPISLLLKTSISPKMLGWELLADAVCRLIGSLANNKFWSPPEEIVIKWLSSLEAALQSRDDNLHEMVVAGPLPAIVSRHAQGSPVISEFFRGVALPSADKDRNINAQRGFTLALGAIPSWLFVERFVPINRLLKRIISSSTTATTTVAIEKRVNAIHATGALYHHLDKIVEGETTIHEEMIAALLEALEDYSVDSRGDIGSLVRLAAMQELPFVLHHRRKDFLDDYIGQLLLNLVGKLDKLRVEAISIFIENNFEEVALLPWEELRAVGYNPQDFFEKLTPFGPVLAGPAISLLTNWMRLGVIDRPFFIAVLTENIKLTRQRRAVLHLLERLMELPERIELSPGGEELIEMICQSADDRSITMHDLLTAVRVLSTLSNQSEKANQWILSNGNSHEYAKVRELCASHPLSTSLE